jgi:superfamily I DNA/RNA helicase
VKSQVRSFIAERKLEGRVNVHHFHEWCGEQLRTYHVEVPHDGGQMWDRQVESVMIVPETGGTSGPGPAFRQFETIGDEIAYAVKCLKAWHERGDFLGDIAVICMKPDHGKRIAHQLQSLGIPHLLMTERSGKRAYDPRKPQVNILSVQSSKGLEFRSVIFIGLGQIESSENEAAQNMKLLCKACPA